jgi:hypothetical protein
MNGVKIPKVRFPFWPKKTILISILCLAIFSVYSSGYEDKAPKKVKVRQTFQEGEELRYKISKSTTTTTGGFKTDSLYTTILCLNIPRVSKEGITDLVVRKVSGKTTIGDQTLPDPNVDKEVRLRLLSNGQLESMDGDITLVEWPELILQTVPDKKLKIGDSWSASQLPPPGAESIKTLDLKYTVVGFEKVRDYDCVKIKIESLMEMEDYKVKKPANIPEGLTIPDEITMSLFLKTEGTAFLLYQQGYIVVKSAKTSKMVTKFESTSITAETKTIVELF